MTGKNHKITVEFTENENGQLAKDLESIIKNEVMQSMLEIILLEL